MTLIPVDLVTKILPEMKYLHRVLSDQTHDHMITHGFQMVAFVLYILFWQMVASLLTDFSEKYLWPRKPF